MKPNFEKYPDGLVPAIIQDDRTQQVLMLGYMNEIAWQKTLQTEEVTFFSRSKQALWKKGESSGNWLELVSMTLDCDQDALLVRALPQGPTCHTGSYSCFGKQQPQGFLGQLEGVIEARLRDADRESYTQKLAASGLAKVAQKVGEEAVETVIEALKEGEDHLLEESADLLYHWLLLLQIKGHALVEVERVLQDRHKAQR